MDSFFIITNWLFVLLIFLFGLASGGLLSEMILPRGKTRLNEMREAIAASKMRATADTLNAMADALDGKGADTATQTAPDTGEGE